ncbi:MAG TPA: hypothetical protein VLB44_02680, partial [Kofleriaceae bacterium]|nr:hypothetical protein [Kofleriaceae bacterium]
MRSLVLLFLIACSSADQPADVRPDAAPDARGSATSQPDAPTAPRFLCRQAPPAGAPVPVSPALPSAGCPTLVPGMNTITTSAKERQFILVVPAATDPGEKLPVLFMWHWIGGSA